MSKEKAQDPLDFMRNMWGGMGLSLPGMVTPTFDVEELEKRITDLKAVEGWLRMNLSMLQMTIQGLEMQKTTLTAVRAMSTMVTNSGNTASSLKPEQGMSSDGGTSTVGDTLSQAALWPWNLMQQMQEHMQHSQEEGSTNQLTPEAAKETKQGTPKPGPRN